MRSDALIMNRASELSSVLHALDLAEQLVRRLHRSLAVFRGRSDPPAEKVANEQIIVIGPFRVVRCLHKPVEQIMVIGFITPKQTLDIFRTSRRAVL